MGVSGATGDADWDSENKHAPEAPTADSSAHLVGPERSSLPTQRGRSGPGRDITAAWVMAAIGPHSAPCAHLHVPSVNLQRSEGRPPHISAQSLSVDSQITPSRSQRLYNPLQVLTMTPRDLCTMPLPALPPLAVRALLPSQLPARSLVSSKM